MTKSWHAYAEHVLDATEKIRQIRTRGDVSKDAILYDAALRNLQTLSEATQRIPNDLKQDFPDIPWADISGFRNILVHNYLGNIDAETIKNVIETHLPELEQAIRTMLQKHA